MAVEYRDYYQILGVSRSASQDEIQKAFKKAARTCHPDLHPNDAQAESRFKQLNEAYEVLKDPEKRKQYDALGAAWKDGQRFEPPPGWGRGRGGSNVHFDFGDAGGMSDFFRLLFGGGMGGGRGGGGASPFGFDFGSGQSASPFGQRRAGSRASAREADGELLVSIEELHQGTVKSINVQTQGPQGVQTREVKLRVPVGARDGTIIKVPQSDGELRLKIKVAEHASWRADGHDLHTKLRLAPWEAALGATVEVDTLDGPVNITVPAGIQSGQKLRLSGRGLNKKQGRGDHFVELVIVVPKELKAEERTLFEKLASISTFRPRESS
ncbi:MAG: DnaJ domain-containing protein [Myxococcota bacterium]|jgi:curved DNA-binding protein|nr:DnaJ domain-containing protein [Myxococcota bacterium]